MSLSAVLILELLLLLAVVRSRRFCLAGHVVRHEEMAGEVLLWKPGEPRRRGRPSATLRKLLLEDTGLFAGRRAPFDHAGQEHVETMVSPLRG